MKRTALVMFIICWSTSARRSLTPRRPLGLESFNQEYVRTIVDAHAQLEDYSGRPGISYFTQQFTRVTNEIFELLDIPQMLSQEARTRHYREACTTGSRLLRENDSLRSIAKKLKLPPKVKDLVKKSLKLQDKALKRHLLLFDVIKVGRFSGVSRIRKDAL